MKWSTSKVSVKSLVPAPKAEPAVSVPPGVCPESRTIKTKKGGADYRGIFNGCWWILCSWGRKAEVWEQRSEKLQMKPSEHSHWTGTFQQGAGKPHRDIAGFQDVNGRQGRDAKRSDHVHGGRWLGRGQSAPPHNSPGGHLSNEHALFQQMLVNTLFSTSIYLLKIAFDVDYFPSLYWTHYKLLPFHVLVFLVTWHEES